MSKMTPQIRFQGFTDDWEERKLGYILSERNDQMPETNEYPLMSFVQGKGVTPKGERYNRSFLVKDSEKKYKKTELGDFIYSSNNLETGSIGFNRTGKAVISPVYSIFKSKKSRESQFIGIMSGRKDFISKMVRFRQGVVYGQWRIHESDFLNIDMKMPNDKEQQLIISFFENIDKTITLHQRMLDLLKKQKKGFLQKMFPKNGAKVPELRFSGFADDWEERKLGELSQDTFGGGTPKTSVTEYWNGEIPWIQSSDLSSDHLFGVLPKKHITENAVKNSATKLIPKNSIAIVTRVGVGKLAFMPYEFTSSQDFLSLSNLQVDCNFGMYSIYKMLQRELNNIQGTSIKGITKADLLDKEVIIPVEFEEQKKIGSFFKQLDNTIALHQRKLDLLKKQKKGFLQKMFVS